MMSPPLVYVAGPYSAPDRAGVEANILRATACGIELARIGCMPVVPHANTSHAAYEQAQPYQFWIDGTMRLLRACDCVMLVPGWEESKGARGEKAEAERLGIPVYWALWAVENWKRAREHALDEMDRAFFRTMFGRERKP